MSPPPVSVTTTQGAFILEQNHHLWVPTTSQNIGAKKPKATTKVTDEPPIKITLIDYTNLLE